MLFYCFHIDSRGDVCRCSELVADLWPFALLVYCFHVPKPPSVAFVLFVVVLVTSLMLFVAPGLFRLWVYPLKTSVKCRGCVLWWCWYTSRHVQEDLAAVTLTLFLEFIKTGSIWICALQVYWLLGSPSHLMCQFRYLPGFPSSFR